MTTECAGVRREREVELSVVVPVFGCAECLVTLHDRLTASVSQITTSYELVFVDDRSVDDGWTVLQALAGRDAHVRAFRLSRNFGQDAAITAGLAQARGNWAVVMDCDLQEAPEDIPRMWAAAREGYDVVRATRRQWSHSQLRRAGSRTFRRLTQDSTARPDYSNLSLLSRAVIDAFLRLHDRDREFMIALDWLGFSTTSIEIQHRERYHGQSSYTLRRLIRVAVDGMFFRTTVLLRLVVLVGFLLSLGGLLLAAFEVADYFTAPNNRIPGYTSLAVLVLVLSGVIIVSVGVVGMYVGRIFEQVKDRPLYLIDAEAGGPDDGWRETPLEIAADAPQPQAPRT
jgi:polyisoprenyl-phosphate glycosyltransferase